MAIIERVSLNESALISDRSVPTSEDASTREESSVTRAPSMPGLRISSRITTASLSDYAEYDLKTLLRNEKRNTVTDGDCS